MSEAHRAPLAEWNFNSLPKVVDADHLATNRQGQRTVRGQPVTGTAIRFSDGESVELIGYEQGRPAPARSIGPLRHEVDSATRVYRTEWITDESGEPWDLAPDVRLRYADIWIDGFVVGIDNHGEARTIEFVQDGWVTESMYGGHDKRASSYSCSANGSRLELRWQKDGTPLNYVERNAEMSVSVRRDSTGRLTSLDVNGSFDAISACRLVNPMFPALRQRNQLRSLEIGSELVLAGNALDIEMACALLSETGPSTVSILTVTSFAGLKGSVLEYLVSTLKPDTLVLKGPEFEELFLDGRAETLRRAGCESMVLERR